MTARPDATLGADWRADMSGQMRHVVTQILMDLVDGYAENRHVRGAPEYNETTALSRKVLLEAIDKVVLTAAPAVVVSAEPVAADAEIERLFVKHGFIYHKCVELGRAILALATPVGPDAVDARDAARWRRLVNASELPFPVLTIADDPENDCRLVYGRKRLKELVDLCDEISDAALASTPSKGAA